MQKGEIFLNDRKQRDYGWLQVLAVEKVPVLGHIPGGVKQVLEVTEQFFVFAGQLFPCTSQPGHWCQVQSTEKTCLFYLGC